MHNIGKILELAVKNGVDSATSISFGSSNAELIQQEVLDQAIEAARKKGARMAKASGVRLKRLISVSEADAAEPPMLQKNLRIMSVAAETSPQILPGQVAIRANVVLQYEIE